MATQLSTTAYLPAASTLSAPIAHRLRPRPDRQWCRVEREIFDDALADGATIHAAGRRAGRTAAQAERQFARIRVELDDQAV